VVTDGVLIDPASDEGLVAVLHAPGASATLALHDARGQVLAQSDGLSTGDPDAVIDEALAPGVYSLTAASTGAAGAETWTAMLTPATPPFQPLAVANGYAPWSSIATGDFTGDGKLDLAVANANGNSVSVLLDNGDGTFQPQVTYAVG